MRLLGIASRLAPGWWKTEAQLVTAHWAEWAQALTGGPWECLGKKKGKRRSAQEKTWVVGRYCSR
jgi:hypothetical protein